MNKLLDCINKKDSSYIPIWFMRQAGRYLPEFREIRKNNQNFVKLCLDVNLASDITIQPLQRFDLDAAIIFSDILMIPYGLGQRVEFKKGLGPILEEVNLDEILNTNPMDFVKKINPIYKIIEKVKKKTKKTVIGFVGAPWTLMVYMINKESPKKNFNFEKIINNKTFTNKLIKKLEDIISLHINKQIEAGADVIQIFDSWAGLLPKKYLNDYCFNPTSNIIKTINNKVPVISFPRGIKENYSDFCKIVKPNCISIDYDLKPDWVKKNLKDICIQGGLDPKILLTDKDNIKKNVEKYLEIFSEQPYIFNLGHGVLPETKPETIKFIIDIIRAKHG